jgi:site-specific DNA-methyltransferase (adenine-specific)
MRVEANNLYNMEFQKGIGEIKEDFIVISDPPYNIDFKYNQYKDNKGEEEYIELISNFKGMKAALIHYPEETMRYYVPALGVPNEVAVWAYNSNLPRQSRLINFFNCKVNFNKVKQPYKNPKDKRIQERIKNGSEGTRLYDWFNDIQLVKNVSKEKNIHPCPIPVKLMERIILLTTNENDLVVDPFMGCGTTAIAAINTKRRYIGFEIDKEYFDYSIKRVNEHN